MFSNKYITSISTSTSQVLAQVHRALKPGGKYLFFEHVAAVSGSSIYYQQLISQPFLYLIGSGCQFKTLWKDIDNPWNLPGYEIDLQNITTKQPMSILIPHIIGSAKKSMQ